MISTTPEGALVPSPTVSLTAPVVLPRDLPTMASPTPRLALRRSPLSVTPSTEATSVAEADDSANAFANAESLATLGGADATAVSVADAPFADAQTNAEAAGLLDSSAVADSVAYGDDFALSVANADAASGIGDADSFANAYSIADDTAKAYADAASLTLLGGDADSESRATAYADDYAKAVATAESLALNGGTATSSAVSTASGK